uniref:Peptide ABC transporter, periplasmic peptide-binding protein, putative n=1 Tax=Chlorobium chlorochromatii (strain CaD3) TaxID=340177 RepID=Q3ATJ8_CHLCH
MEKKPPFALIVALLLVVSTLYGCHQQRAEEQHQQVVTAISADFDYLNPLLIQFAMSREMCKLLYPSLVRPAYDSAQGTIRFLPNAAKQWKFSPDGKGVTFHLNRNARWEDGVPVTSHDFKFSYALYKNPAVASTRQHYLNDLPLLPDGSPDVERAVETPNDSTLVIHFSNAMAEEIVLDHLNDLMPVARHRFKDFRPEEIRQRAAELPLLSAGPFRVKEWKRQERLVLEPNPTSALPHPATLKSMVFMVVPEYTTRLAMLKAGQIDAMLSAGGINPKDVPELHRSAPNVVIRPVQHRYFDSIVWLNIDGECYRTRKQIAPHPLFGDKRVRQALTLAIDRQSIIDGFMGPDHATIVNTSLSPAYRTLADSSLDAYAYNPRRASMLLRQAGWLPGANGILQKNGKPFSFELAAPTGNPRRNYAATIIQQNLRAIGIDCRLRFDEGLIFNRNQNEFRYDAALSGMAAETLPFQLIIWGSNFAERPFNSAAFQNRELDEVIAQLSKPNSPTRKRAFWQRYQQILHEEQPRTFLYYYDELEGFNKRIRNAEVNMLSTLYNLHEWQTE